MEAVWKFLLWASFYTPLRRVIFLRIRRNDVDISVTLKLAAEDIKSYYVEGVTSQPGQEGLSSSALKEWFWNHTTAGKVLLALVASCSKSENEKLRMTASYFIAPMDVLMNRNKPE